VLSFSKSYGPDLRLAAVGGAGEPIRRLASRRALGPGWSSRLLQQVLLRLLADARTRDTIDRARAVYAERQRLVGDHLRDRGLPCTIGDGINLWLDVPDEQTASVVLAAHGIGVAPGSPFEVEDLGADHVRVTVGLVSRDHRRIADRIADAARPRPRGRITR
jgi:DNA-binding transcriptional MocR family regulator